jgi:uncharacterized protein YecT (DUF1311 family)
MGRKFKRNPPVRLRGLVAFWACMVWAPCALPESTAEEFGAHRWPTQPRLGVNKQSELCNKILATTVGLFKSSDTDLDVAGAIAVEHPPLTMQPVIEGQQEGSPSMLGQANLDLEGDGSKQVVVYRDLEFNWRGNWHYAYVFPSVAAFDAAKANIAADWLEVPKDGQYPPPSKREFDAQQYYPSALTVGGEEIQTGDVWADHSLFAFGSHYYFADGTSAFDREIPAATQIYQLHANGRVELTCSVEPGDATRVYAGFQDLPAIGALLNAIRIIGAGGEDGGTLHSGQMHDAQAAAAERRAAYRPWATSAETQPAYSGDHPYYRYDERMRYFLESWSLEELWTRREYQTLLELTGPAEASYATYLQSSFGLSADASRVSAVKVIEALIAARLEVPSQYNVDQERLYFPSTALHEAVMHRDRAAFDSALQSPQPGTEPAGRPEKPALQIISDALPDSVEWPYGIDQLLAAGADPNQANGFGKTALMVAAHFDRPDSVRKLIKAGARVNASTPPSTGSLVDAPKRAGRTALMYAAENASPITIKALLDAGADPSAKDSDGNDLSFYLKNNPRLTDAERLMGVTGLAPIADRFSGPSFSCSKAHTPTEQAICGSEVLRLFDAQIARAFSSLQTQAGAAELASQRDWLRARDRACAADADCLAEKMRTHLRYLQERLAELPGVPVKP